MKFSAIFTALILITLSCEPLEKIDDIPEIGFKSLEGPYLVQTEDSTTLIGAFLTFSFQDGNSDFGVDMAARPADSINLYLVPFQKVDGTYDSVDAELYGRQYTVKKDDKMGEPGQPVKGEIEVLVTYLLKPPFDTLRYEFYILDRAFNKSNVESTSDIAF
jgi:hypothetical protein